MVSLLMHSFPPHTQTNDALVAPLLRLKDNNCHLDESERVLKKYQKYSELIILYEKKDLHKKGEASVSLHLKVANSDRMLSIESFEVLFFCNSIIITLSYMLWQFQNWCLYLCQS